MQIELHHSKIVPNPLNKIIRGSSLEDQDSIKELADSIAQQGIIQPLEVTVEGGHYRLLVGERRWRAACLLDDKAPLLPCIINNNPGSELDQLLRMGAENAQRENMPPITEAKYFLKLQELGLDIAQIARETNKKVHYIKSKLALLDLAEPLQQGIEAGRIPQSVYKELGQLSKQAQCEMAEKLSGKKAAYIKKVAKIIKAKYKAQQARPKDEAATLRQIIQVLLGRLNEAMDMIDQGAEALAFHEDILSEEMSDFATEHREVIRRAIRKQELR